MFLRVSSPGTDLSDADVTAIQQDVEKIDRRLQHLDEVYLEVRLSKEAPASTREATLALEYGPNHLVATATGADARHAIRNARDELLKQMGRTERGGHSDRQKRG